MKVEMVEKINMPNRHGIIEIEKVTDKNGNVSYESVETFFYGDEDAVMDPVFHESVEDARKHANEVCEAMNQPNYDLQDEYDDAHDTFNGY